MRTYSLWMIIFILTQVSLITSCPEQTGSGHPNNEDCSQHSHNVWVRDVKSCSKGSQAVWRFKYFDEQRPGFLALVEDDTLDERLSNLIYTTGGVKLVNVDMFVHNQGDSTTNEKLERLAADSKVDDELCGKQLAQMIALFDDMKNIVSARRSTGNATFKLTEKHNRLAKVLDSFGHYEAGLHTGRYVFSGSYEQCQGSQMILGDDNTKTAARFCFAKLDLDKHLHPTLRHRTREPYEQSNQLTVGVCLPETCHSLSFRRHKHLIKTLLDEQFQLPDSMYVNPHLDLVSLYCPPVGDSPLIRFPSSGILLIAILITWTVATLYVTFFDYKKKPEESKANPLRDALNLKSSMDDFCMRESTKRSERIDLDVLNPIKVLGCMLNALGHALMFSWGVVPESAKAFKDVDYDPWIFLVLSSATIVDTFYVITGILGTYLIMRKYKSRLEKKESTMREYLQVWANIACSRFARLFPLYFVVYWFKRSVFAYLGQGPLWDRGLNMHTMQGGCKHESWLFPVSFLPAYTPLSKQCIPQAWAIVSDLFFFTLLTPVILLLISRIRLAILISVALAVASNLDILRTIQNLDPIIIQFLNESKANGIMLVYNMAGYLHTATHMRIPSFLIGVFAGYALYQYNEGKALKQWPYWMKGPATWLSWLMIIVITFSPVLAPMYRDSLEPVLHQMDFLQKSLITSRTLWSLSNAILMLRMMTDWKDSHIGRISAGTFWKTMSKLNFAIMLVSIDLIVLHSQLQDSFTRYNKFNVKTLAASSYLFSVLIGFFIHVMVENPLDKLIKNFIK